MPEKPQQGLLYISREYKTATHLCCCGCGLEVVTPLNPAKWRITDHGDSVSLTPSIGNWSFPCESHYWIDHGAVKWSTKMSQKQIEAVRQSDQKAVEVMLQGHGQRSGWLGRLINWIFKK